jgi:hypothetical protein
MIGPKARRSQHECNLSTRVRKAVKTHAQTSSQSRGFGDMMRARTWWICMAAANVKICFRTVLHVRKEAKMDV